MTANQQKHTNQRSSKKAATDQFKIKIARLTSLVEQIKRYAAADVNAMLGLEKVEYLLSQPELTDRDWTEASPKDQARFLDFLKIHIFVYAKVLTCLEQRTLKMN